MKLKKFFSCLLVVLALCFVLVVTVFAADTAYYHFGFRGNNSYSTNTKSLFTGDDVKVSFTTNVTIDAGTSSNSITMIAMVKKKVAGTDKTVITASTPATLANSSSSQVTYKYYKYAEGSVSSSGDYYAFYRVKNATTAYYFDTTLRFYR